MGMFFNWTLSCDEEPMPLPQTPGFADIVQHRRNLLRLSPRFTWLVGPERESEVWFWRAFALSEAYAMPIYGEVGRILDSLSGPEPQWEKVGALKERLEAIADVLDNLKIILEKYVNKEHISIDSLNKLQKTAHFAGTTAGASGFQIPFMVLLDALLGTNYDSVPKELKETRGENICEMNQHLVDVINSCVAPRSKDLRAFVLESDSSDLKDAYQKVCHKLVIWRGSHRARAAQFLENSLVTTGRTAEDMKHTVRETFQNEMNSIIHATAAVTAQQQSEQMGKGCPMHPTLLARRQLDVKSPSPSGPQACPFLGAARRLII